MGKPQPKSDLPPYRDDPSLDDALSLHTTPGDHEQDDLPEFNADETLAVPPPYSDNSREEAVIDENEFVNGPEGVIWKANDGSLTVSHEAYDKNPKYLLSSIKRWFKEPPAIYVRILGTHSQKVRKGDKTENEKVTDFDMKVRLTEYLLTHQNHSTWTDLATANGFDKTYRGTVLKSRSKANDPEQAPPSVLNWCEDYCQNKSTLKRFKFTREVNGLDRKMLEENLTSLIRNTNYRGNLQITFPLDNPSVEVYSAHWINRARHSMVAIVLSIITATIIIFWPILALMTKRYEVVRGVWWFSIDNSGNRMYATVSEIQWFNTWSKTIERQALQHRQGLLTTEDLRNADAPVPEPNTGNRYLDAATNLISVGANAHREVNRQLGWGFDT